MASELNPGNPTNRTSGESRRSFLVKLGIGAAALALAAGSLSAIRGGSSNRSQNASSQEFPGEDSIFHPGSDPRQDPRRIGRG